MIVPEYIRFYGYTSNEVLLEYAKTFFALVNSMYRLQAKEALLFVNNVAAAMSGKDGKSHVEALQKQEKGLHGIVQEVRVIKG
jgi:hypothetical protein